MLHNTETEIEGVDWFRIVFVNRSMESIILNQLTSEIPDAYQGPELAMSEWYRNTAHSIEKPTILRL